MEALEAEFVNTKRLVGRGVVQIILELPEEMAPAIHERLGYPTNAHSIWVGLVRLMPPVEREELKDVPEPIAVNAEGS